MWRRSHTTFCLVLVRKCHPKNSLNQKYRILHTWDSVLWSTGMWNPVRAAISLSPSQKGGGEKFLGEGSTHCQGHSLSWGWWLLVQPSAVRGFPFGRRLIPQDGCEAPAVSYWFLGWKGTLHGCLFISVCLTPEGLLEISLPCNVSGCGRQHQFSPSEDLLYCLAYFSAVSWNCKIGNDKTCRNES